MAAAWQIPTAVLLETLRAIMEAAPFVLLGLLVAGLLHEFLHTARLIAVLGGRTLRSIVAATFLGAPLPLCSCGVLPAAVALRKKGASREAAIAFLISTPETGIDSIALTYGLLGPFMAVARPLAAIVTGIVAGVVSLFQPEVEGPGPGGTDAVVEAHDHVHAIPDLEGEEQPLPTPGMRTRLPRAMGYGFVTLLDDLAFFLVLGFVATGILAVVLPPDFFTRVLPGGFVSLLVMALLGIPTYVCASASTPVVAAMLAKGLNPGAALVFMLTGPATNASTIAIVSRLFGRRFVLTYLGAIFGVALLAGTLANAILGAGWVPLPTGMVEGSDAWGLLQAVAGIGLLGLMGRSLVRTGLGPGIAELRDHLRALTGWASHVHWTAWPWRAVFRLAVAVAVLLWLGSGLVAVGPGEAGLRRRFGHVGTRLGPGLHLYWPAPIGRVDVVATDAVRTVEVGYTDMPGNVRTLTSVPRSFPRILPAFGEGTAMIPEGATFVAGDETVVSITAVIQYQVDDPARYELTVDRPDMVIRGVARAALVDALARTPIDAVYSSARGEVEAAALAALRTSPMVRAIGVRPLSLHLLYVHAPDEVHAAFRDVASAAEDATTTRNKALVEAEGEVNVARGDAARLLAEAEAYRVDQVERARGNAAAFVPLAAEDRRASSVTRDRLYLEAMERVLGRAPKLIKPAPTKAPGLELWITPAGTDVYAPASAPIPGMRSMPEDDEGPSSPRPSPRPPTERQP